MLSPALTSISARTGQIVRNLSSDDAVGVPQYPVKGGFFVHSLFRIAQKTVDVSIMCLVMFLPYFLYFLISRNRENLFVNHKWRLEDSPGGSGDSIVWEPLVRGRPLSSDATPEGEEGGEGEHGVLLAPWRVNRCFLFRSNGMVGGFFRFWPEGLLDWRGCGEGRGHSKNFYFFCMHVF